MPSTNFHNLARVRETTLGVTPGSPAMENCFITADSLKIARQFVKSETITGLRGTKEHLPVGIAVEGGGSFELAFGYADWAFELVQMDSFAALVEAVNITADSNITDINSTTQTLLAAGAWAEGMLIATEGLDTAGNNKDFRAQAGTGAGTIIAPAGTFTANDTAPAAGARVFCYGFQGASGDISATATGLASASNAFASLPLLPNMGLKIGGSAVGDQFATTALNTFARIKSIAQDGSSIELDELPAGWTTDAGTGKTIILDIGDDSRTGDTVLTDTMQRRNKKSSPVFGQALVGVAGQSLQMQFPLNGVVTGQLGVIGITGSVLTTLLDASPADPAIGVGDIMKTGSNIVRLTEGGAAVGAAVACQEMSQSFSNNLTPVGDLTKDEAIDYDPGDADVVDESTYRAGSKALLEKYLAADGGDSKKMIVIRRGSKAYQFSMLKGTYTDYEDPVQGRNQQWLSRARLEMKIDTDSGGLYVMTRYRRLS